MERVQQQRVEHGHTTVGSRVGVTHVLLRHTLFSMTTRNWILNERDCWSEIGKESNSERIEHFHATVGFEMEITHALLSMSTDCS